MLLKTITKAAVQCARAGQNSVITRSMASTADKVKFVFRDHEGDDKVVYAKEGESLLEVAHNHNVDLEGACDGTLACSTCHVILPKDIYSTLAEPEEEELDMLDLAFGLTDTSRLGCQVLVKKEFENMIVKIPAATRDARS
eukprot:Colp12_sorted_trinity150504_noHs@26184